MNNQSIPQVFNYLLLLLIFSSVSTLTFGQCQGSLWIAVGPSDASCYGLCDGSADVSVTSGTPPYTYLWDDPQQQTTAIATGLCGGITYLVMVTDAASEYCDEWVTIGQPQAITSYSNSQDESCAGICDGGINFNSGSGGTSPYTYNWSGGAGSGSSASNLCPGVYTVSVTDANGCDPSLHLLTINGNPCEPTNASVTNTSCPNSTDGSIEMQGSGSGCTGSWTYQWSDGGSGKDRFNLPSGTYSVMVTNTNSCQTTATYVVGTSSSLTASATSSNISCNGGNDGIGQVTASGNAPPYQYLWSNGATTPTITGLFPGSYQVTVTDGYPCAVYDTITITEPSSLGITVTWTDETCSGSCDGTGTAFATGGTAPYTYDWGGNNTNALCAGTYTVLVTDANGCTDTETINIGTQTNITLSFSVTDASCSNTNDGYITVSATGGTTPYTYLWDAQAQNQITPTATGLGSGTYQVTVTDVSGCSVTGGTVVVSPPDLNVQVSQTDPSCYGTCDGFGSIIASGGTGQYTYSWSNGASSTTTALQNLCEGVYSVTVMDSLGCQAFGNIQIVDPAEIIIAILSNDVTCNGDCDGRMFASVPSGQTGLNYQWDAAAGGSVNDTVLALCAGSYSVTVTDGSGCFSTATDSIEEPGPLVAIITTMDVTCFGNNDGGIMAQVNGGTLPYTYTWNGGLGSSANSISGLGPGNNTLMVRDSNGCWIIETVPINSPSELALAYTVTDPTCYGSCDGQIDASGSGGTPPYLYNGQTTSVSNGICSGNYPVQLTDSNNCSVATMISVTDPPNIQLTIVVTDASCGEDDGSAEVTAVANGTPPYVYQWTNGSYSSLADSLGAGIYLVTVTDANGCGNFGIAAVSDQNGPSISLNSMTPVSCYGFNDGAIDANVTGGQPPYTYLWSNGQGTEDITGLVAGPYELTVYDTSGCSTTQSISVPGPDPLDLEIVMNHPPCDSATGSIEVNVSGGTEPYTYNWSTGITDTVIYNCPSGIFDVTVTDGNGCQEVGVAAMGNAGGTTVVVDSVLDADCGGSGGVYVTISGGTSPFSYTWTLDSVVVDTLEDLIGVAPGVYDLLVIDSAGCLGATSVTISGVVSEPEEICIVTVDLDTQTNLIVWEKTNTNNVASYNIYKESTTAGVYYLIANVPVSPDSSFYLDTVSDPSTRAWRYKISVVDSCGNESELSSEHKTMHLTINLGLNNSFNLIWDHYEGIDSLLEYKIARYLPSTGWERIDSVPSTLTSYTDTPPATINLYYRIDIDHPLGCYPSKIKSYNTSKSNTTLIGPKENMGVATSSTDATTGICNGTATVNASGGVSPYTYLWDDLLAQTTQTAIDLCPGTYSVLVTDLEGDTITGYAAVGTAPGIYDVLGPDILSIYPNPTNGKTTIALQKGYPNNRLVIYDLLGQDIYETHIIGQKVAVDLSETFPGTYFVQLITNDGVVIRKLVIE